MYGSSVTEKTRLAIGGVFLATLCVVHSNAQTVLPATKEQVSPQLEEQFKQTDAIFSKFDTTRSPGCALAVMRDGRVLYKRGYGMADLDHNIPIEPDTVFHVASMSKQFTATAILLLVKEGKLSLDDDVRKYLPQLPEFGPKVTIQELMHHTSGIRDQWNLLDLAGWRYSQDLITDDDIMGLVDRQKELNFQPGSHILYDNTGYTLLAQVVSSISGQSLRTFSQTNIFGPLGMNSTHFRDSHAEVVKRDAYGYKPTKERDVYDLSLTNFDTVGATGLLTTVEDLAHWDENFYSHQIGGPDLAQMQLDPGHLNDGSIALLGDFQYAAGLEIGQYRGLRIIAHSGADAGYVSDMIRFPDQHFTVACLCNRSDLPPNQLIHKVADIFLAKEFAKTMPDMGNQQPSSPSSADNTKSLAGLYWSEEFGRYLRIIESDGQLRVQNADGTSSKLTSLTEATFQVQDGPTTFLFQRQDAGDTWKAYVRHESGLASTTYVKVQAFQPTPVELRAYEGTYTSAEIDTQLHIQVNNGYLVLRRAKRQPEQFTPTMKDAFEDPVKKINVRFERGINGQIVGLLWDAPRLLNVRFTKRSSLE